MKRKRENLKYRNTGKKERTFRRRGLLKRREEKRREIEKSDRRSYKKGRKTRI